MAIQRTSTKAHAPTSKTQQSAKTQHASQKPAVKNAAAAKKASAAPSTFHVATPKAKAAHEPTPIAHRRTDPAKEFPDFLTGLGGFTQLQWKPLRDTLADFKAGHVHATAGGRSDMVPVDAKEIRRELDAFLKQPEVEKGLYRDGNIYEVEAKFLRKWGMGSRDELNDRVYRGEPGLLEVPRGQEKNPVHGAASQIFRHAESDPKYGALLNRVLEDPLTALMLIRGNSIGSGGGSKLQAHEQHLATDLHDLAWAKDKLQVNGELARELPGGNEALERTQLRLKIENQAEQGLRELKQMGGAKKPRIDAAMVGLSWKKPDFTAI
jgi:hypothetical protein